MPVADTKAKPRWERRKDARPQELLDAALDLFVERGYAATRLDDVASRAGVSKGTLYLYFENKEELFKAVVRANLVSALAEAEDYVAQYTGSSRELLRGFILRWWERIGETKLSGISKLMMAESGNFPDVARFYHEEVIQRSNALIISMLEHGISRGEFRPVDKVNANLVIVAPVVMLMMWKHSFHSCRLEPISTSAYLDCFLDLLLNGLQARASQSHDPLTIHKNMSTRSRQVVLLVLVIAAVAAGGFFMRPKAHAAPAKAIAAPAALEFLPQEIFTAAPVDLQKTLALSGALRAFDVASVKARVAADVREVLVREGEAVKSGQIVVKMDATEYLARVEQARGNLNSARAQLDIATKNRDNNRSLVQKGFISRNAFDNYASQYAAAEANVEATKGSLDIVQKSLNDTVIRAPISGLVAMRYVQPGEKVSADNKLLDIVDLRKMEMEAAVPTSDISSVALQQRVMLRIEGLPQQFEGKVVRINPATQAGSRSVLVYVQIDNPQGLLRAGMFTEAQLVLTSKPGVLALPQNAVRKDGNGAFVYVIEGERLARKPVVMGMNGRSGNAFMTEIQSGLDFGAKVVATDMGSLQPGALVRIAPAK